MTSAPEAAITDAEELPFETRINPRWALSFEQVLLVAVFAAIYLMLAYIPLRATDLWGHVAYGHWILEHGRLPTEDPAMSLARGMQVVDTAWLSQVIFAAVDRWLGPAAISHLFAIVGLLTYGIWARVFFLQSQRVWLSALCTLLLIFVGWSRLATVRPESFGGLCCAALFLLIARRQLFYSTLQSNTESPSRFDWMTWIGVPFVLALWANLHGSFVVGLLVLACLFGGRVIEVLWNRRSLAALLGDRETRGWLYLTELALLATLLNPYGVDLWIYTARFSSNPNLATVSEWQSLMILGPGGRQFAASIVLLLIVWRHSRQAICPAEVLLLAVFSGATIDSIRMIGWYAPVFVYVITPHLANLVAQRWPARRSPSGIDEEPAADGQSVAEASSPNVPLPGHSFRYSMIAVLVIWIAFALSPLSQPLFPARPPRNLFDPNTPLKLTEFLAHPPADNPLARKDQWADQVFNSQAWGDWLNRAGPAEFKPFVTTNIHLVPSQVWNDYNRVNQARNGWERVLDRYRVKTIVVDKKEQSQLYSVVKSHANWQNVYDDEQGAVFVRRAEPSSPATPADSPAEDAV